MPVYQTRRTLAVPRSVFADLPCSGLGVIGKKPDIKYRMDMEQIKALAALQREILTATQKAVAPGGTLIYSTCTVNPAENIENAAGLRKILILSWKRSASLSLGTDLCDGFFIARFTRRPKP